MGAGLEGRLDVRKIPLAERQGFFAELLARSLVGQRTSGKEVRGRIATELLVVRAIDLARAANTNPLAKAMAAACLRPRRRHPLRRRKASRECGSVKSCVR